MTLRDTSVRELERVRDTDRRARLRHIYRGYECHPAPRGAVAYCGHVKQTAPGKIRILTAGPYGDTCVVCWDLHQ